MMTSSMQGRKLRKGMGVGVLALLSALLGLLGVMGPSLPELINETFASTTTRKIIVSHGQKKTLPKFENGGILVFYHIYKTGGSTVGKMMHELSQANSQTSFFNMIRKTVEWEEHCELYLDMAQTQRKLVMLELHVEFPAPNFPSLVEMAPILDRWRLEAQRREIDFFAFTLVREPKAHAISFFNFFHVGSIRRAKEWNPFKPLIPTEENFLHALVGNRQCQMLGSDPEGTLAAPTDIVWSEPELSSFSMDQYTCQIEKVYRVLFQTLDWVGTTENLQNETLPLLTMLIMNNPEIGRKVVPFKVFAKSPISGLGLSLDDLSERSLSILERKTELDRRLYDDVRRNFTLPGFGWDNGFSM